MEKDSVPEEFLPFIRRLIIAKYPKLASLSEEEWWEVEKRLGEDFDIEPTLKN
jgi:hypothetical protein